MDYKYIEQLLESYWQCETTPEEELILRTFFRQGGIPAHLAKFKPLFEYQEAASRMELGADFDRRMLDRIEQQPAVVRARRVPLRAYLRPFYRAAAVIAIVLTLGNAAQHSFRQDEGSGMDYNYATYQDTYSDPEVAYEQVSSALKLLSDGIRPHEGRMDTVAAVKNNRLAE